MNINRRQLLKLSALGGGAVLASSLPGCASLGIGRMNATNDFYFVQLSDIHWGFKGAPNPDAANTLKKAIVSVNALDVQPDFIMFTGDLTHTTDDPKERRRRLAEFKEIAANLKVQNVRFMPGEHDASLDFGAAYKEFFGETFYSFDHRGVHFVVVDNVSDPGAKIGEEQLTWLAKDLATRKQDDPIVIFTHRPLFDLVPKWDWATRDGSRAIEMLMAYKNVTVFYGHIHQEHHHMTGHIAHHAAKSLIFPLPAPGSQEKRTPLPWNEAAPHSGLGFREVEAEDTATRYKVTEFPVVRV